MATVVVPPAVLRVIDDIPTPIVARMRKLVQRLRQWPDVSGVKHLKRDLAGKHQLRTEEVEEEQEITDYKVIVEKAGHRDGFYDE